MSAHHLHQRPVERIWGRRDLSYLGTALGSDPIGEIWFEECGPFEPELLVKYLFTSERLSIQVHPDDTTARAHGYRSGKDEAWYVIDAKPDALIGLGLKSQISKEELLNAVCDGSIESLVDWRPVRAGDLLYSPAGTIHAIGAGLSLIEIQQNLDLTYRLYDYGRPRELHVDEGVAVARPGPSVWRPPTIRQGPGRDILIAGPAFVLERWRLTGRFTLMAADSQALLIPLESRGQIDGQPLVTPSVWRLGKKATLDVPDCADLLVAYPGREIREGLCQSIQD